LPDRNESGLFTGGFMFGGKIGMAELAVIVFIALLIFGPKKLGELGKGLGEGIRNFRASMSEHSAPTATAPTEEKKQV
jgi:sec-independent protein translocase protein TatA